MRRTGFAANCQPLALIGALLGASVGASAGPAAAPPDYDFQWAVIGAPGNRPTNPEEVPNNDHLRIGAVEYQYRLSKTETSGAQWLEFVRAYAPYVGSAYNASDFRGGSILFTGFNSQGVPTYSMNSIMATRPATLGWRYAARYANWLHNDKAMTREAFENGAYDTSTFGALPDGTLTDQAAHSPNAKFWLPTLDEWIKAAYYDPAKDGGAGGYWLHPGQSDAALISGRPGDSGAQTGAGVSQPPYPYDISLYPELGPWGLYDMSGGAREWTETFEYAQSGLRFERVIRGSETGQGETYAIADRLDLEPGGAPPHRLHGLRIASVVPTPSAMLMFGLTLFATRRVRQWQMRVA